jgi:hypothetical protein
MKHFTTTSLMTVLVAIALLLAVSTALAQGNGYDLSWFTVDGGGGTVSNGGSGYALTGTAGQPDAGALTNGSYTLVGGFWGGAAAAATPGIRPIYLPLILRNF